ncbi:hypothetical protein GCM10022285_26780 [Streptomyces tunisiensis]|uniref:Uncharacterized protein n=1 Tax=Streptomyces tunisiensis TaxID=948699 RepID=A0ABP7YCY6_9ACTN
MAGQRKACTTLSAAVRSRASRAAASTAARLDADPSTPTITEPPTVPPGSKAFSRSLQTHPGDTLVPWGLRPDPQGHAGTRMALWTGRPVLASGVREEADGRLYPVTGPGCGSGE